MAKYTMCGGEDPRAPGCHRVVWKKDVNRDGLCCDCGKPDEPAAAAEKAPADSNG